MSRFAVSQSQKTFLSCYSLNFVRFTDMESLISNLFLFSSRSSSTACLLSIVSLSAFHFLPLGPFLFPFSSLLLSQLLLLLCSCFYLLSAACLLLQILYLLLLLLFCSSLSFLHSFLFSHAPRLCLSLFIYSSSSFYLRALHSTFVASSAFLIIFVQP